MGECRVCGSKDAIHQCKAEPKHTPIPFNAEMVRAILDGSKTQTRRLVKLPKDLDSEHPGSIWELANRPECWGAQDDVWAFVDQAHPVESYPYGVRCPYGQPGDRLWVRETWQCIERYGDGQIRTVLPVRSMVELGERELIYAASVPDGEEPPRWRPSIHMHRWASRIALEVVSVRVERVQDITDDDAIAEGITVDGAVAGTDIDTDGDWWPGGPVRQFRRLWDSINTKPGHGWDANPWVWVVEFRRVDT